ncbi:MAG: isochorismate synthase [Methylomonas sp.]|jgi:isochorismate synthase
MQNTIDRKQLKELLQQGADRARKLHRPILVSVTQAVAAPNYIDLFESIHKLDDDYAFFWVKPDKDFAIISLGAAFLIEESGPHRFSNTASAWKHLLEHAVIHDAVVCEPRADIVSGPILSGGFVYDTAIPATGIWQNFADGSFTLPRLQVNMAGEQSNLTLNVLATAQLDAEIEADNLIGLWDQVINGMHIHQEQFHDGYYMINTEDLMPASIWKQIVHDATASIVSGAFEKTVLARTVKITSNYAFNIKLALQRLCEFFPDAYVFAVHRKKHCFLGATPERLAKLTGDSVMTTALAGTCRRGANPADDNLLGEQLLHSEKDLHEHQLVVQMIRATLSAFCNEIKIPEQPVLLKLRNVQHLYTPITGRLSTAKTLLDIVEILHPTPAVCGLPRIAAQTYIRGHEKLDRGWYAAPIGWIDGHGGGEFAVALRSALLIDENLGYLFAGCGIVANSNPESEYQETILKLGTMLFALGAEDRRKSMQTVESERRQNKHNK